MIGDHVIEKREVYTKYPEIVVTLTVDGDNMVVVSIPGYHHVPECLIAGVHARA